MAKRTSLCLSRFTDLLCPIVLCLVALSMSHGICRAGEVTLQRVPNDGIQPQVIQESNGTIHLVYYAGDPASGDLFYCKRTNSDEGFSRPIQVNSGDGSSVAMGTIRGAQIAIGRNGRVHVVWNGSGNAAQKGPHGEPGVLYSRLNDSGTAFEETRNVVSKAYGLDGGACVAADHSGNVFIAWHAGQGHGEEGRRVWMARSNDDGATFLPEQPIDIMLVGACGCCGMTGGVDAAGNVQFLYRSAQKEVNRDMHLLTSTDGGDSFAGRKLQDWRVKMCPMSSATIATKKSQSWAAWETNGQVQMSPLPVNNPVSAAKIVAPAGNPGGRKHPAIAMNSKGETLLVWTEGTGWKRGGRLAWQRFDADGRPVSDVLKSEGIPVWSFAATWAKDDGSFVILH
jgi:hypothetical protein